MTRVKGAAGELNGLTNTKGDDCNDTLNDINKINNITALQCVFVCNCQCLKCQKQVCSACMVEMLHEGSEL